MREGLSINRVIFYSFGLSGFSALVYEVVWFRALSLVIGSTTYALSTMLATFMAGLSIGAFLGGKLADMSDRPVLLYAYIEGGIAITALLVLPAVNLLPPLYAWLFYTFRFSFEAFSASQFIICSLVMLIPTILMGATFPMVCKVCFTGREIGSETGGVYAINTIGAIAGSVAAGFILIPVLGMRGANIAAASINLVIAVNCVVLVCGRVPRNFMVIAGFFTAALFAANTVVGADYPFNYYLGGRYASYGGYLREFAFSTKVYERDDPSGNIKVLEGPTGEKLMVNNGKIESNDIGDRVNLAMLAYLPVSANPSAKSFLNIGLGTGGTVHYAAGIPTLEEIYSIEINSSIMEASRLYFYPDIFKDQRIRFVTADARNYLSMADRRYDVISSEPSYPVDQGFSHLYSMEFFQLVKSRLNDGGVFCQWVPRYIFRGQEFRMIARTFQTAFPGFTVWRAKKGDFLLLGRKGGEIDGEEALKKISTLMQSADLPAGQFFIESDRSDAEMRLKDYKGEINTDDRPIVEFIGARRMYEAF